MTARKSPPLQPPVGDFDLFAARRPRRASIRWLMVGGIGFVAGAFFCLALILIDLLILWCDFPVVVDIFQVLGFCN